ncbi:PEP-CTERM sorting domain-containing protein [Oceaniferula spumae]
MKLKYTIAALGVTTMVANAAVVTTQADVSTFSHQFTGSEIYDGSSYQNGWTGGADTANYNLTTTGSILRIQTVGSQQGSTLNGTNSTNGTTIWNDINSGEFSLEMNVKVNATNAEGFRLMWAGNDTERYFVDITTTGVSYNLNGGGVATFALDTTDGFHTYRLVGDNEAAASTRFHLYVDNVEVTDPNGGVFSSGTNDSRLLSGDTTSGTFGDSYDIEYASIAYDTAAFAPVPEPSSAALLGLGGIALILRRKR